MKKHLCLFFIIFSHASLSAEITVPKLCKLSPTRAAVTTCLNPEYLVFHPNESQGKSSSLLIYLHGGGGVGSDVYRVGGQANVLVDGIKRFAKGPCFVVVPQCKKSKKDRGRGTWQAEDLNYLLDELLEKLPIDPQKVYLTGNSMGGYGSWLWGGHSPSRFAAIAPIVGGIGPNGPKDVTPDLDRWAANLAKVPVYAFAGARDKVVPAERSERMVAAIRKAGGKQVKIKIYQDQGHNARHVVYSTREFYDWMFSKKSK